MSDLDATDLVCKARREALSGEETRRLEGLLRTSLEARLVSSILCELERESSVQPGDDARVARMAARAAGQPERLTSRRMAAALAAVAVALVAAAAGAWRATRTIRQPGPVVPAATASAAPGGVRATAPPPVPSAARQDPPQPLRAPGEAVHSPPPSAATLFARANLLRREGNNDEAMRLYRAVVDRYPGAREAPPARLALAKLLGASNPGQALVQYQALSRSAGPLRAEALWGVAESARRLGQPAVERQALSELLASFPDSSYAAVARGRLADAAP